MGYLKPVYGLLALLMAGVAWSADTLTPEQKEVKQFIEKMYSYDPDTLELGRFYENEGGGFLQNRAPSKRGKYQPPKQCELLGNFFESTIIKKLRYVLVWSVVKPQVATNICSKTSHRQSG